MEIKYHPHVLLRDLPALDKVTKVRVDRAISQKLTRNPLLYGEPLRGILKPAWKLRVGDWRVIYTIKGRDVFVWMIGHRKSVYINILKRF